MQKLQPQIKLKKNSLIPEAEFTTSFFFKNLLGFEMGFLTVEGSVSHRRYYSGRQSNPESGQ